MKKKRLYTVIRTLAKGYDYEVSPPRYTTDIYRGMKKYKRGYTTSVWRLAVKANSKKEAFERALLLRESQRTGKHIPLPDNLHVRQEVVGVRYPSYYGETIQYFHGTCIEAFGVCYFGSHHVRYKLRLKDGKVRSFSHVMPPSKYMEKMLSLDKGKK